MIRNILSVLLSGLLAVTVTSAEAEALKNPLPTPNSDAANANVAVLLEDNGLCTGTLITPEWVLTAKHCWEQSSSQVQKIGFGRDGLQNQVSPLQHVSHPEEDIGLIRIPPVHDIKPLSIDFTGSGIGDPVEIYGRGGQPWLGYGKFTG